MISVPSHFSEPFGTTKSNQKLSWHSSCEQLFDPEFAL
jgi:hypothetical protein